MEWIKLNFDTFKNMIDAHKNHKCILLATCINFNWCYDIYQTNVFNTQYLINSDKYYYMIINEPK